MTILRSRLVLFVFLAVARPAFAQGTDETTASGSERWHAWADTDVFAYTVGGYSLHVGVRPPASPWRFAVGSFGTAHNLLPRPFLESLLYRVNSVATDNEGWRAGVNAWTAEAFYDFSSPGSTFFAGAYVIDLRWHRARAASASRSSAHQLSLMPAAGYRWYPVTSPVYLTAWMGFGVNSPEFAGHASGPESYQALRLYPFGSLHLGYEL